MLRKSEFQHLHRYTLFLTRLQGTQI